MGSTPLLHPTAQIDAKARIAADVRVGPYTIIGNDVEIGPGCRIDAHVVIEGPTRIGEGTRIHAFSVIGGAPQDRKYAGESTRLELGARNTIREYVTINRGTQQGGGVTRVGDDNWIMAYVHVAHDCMVGNNTVLANNATLAGHVRIDDWVILGGFTGVHQFCRIGAHAFVGMGSMINADVPPFVIAAGQYARPRGINSEGLKRRGFDSERIALVRRAYRAIYSSGRPLADVRAELAERWGASPEIQELLAFIDASERSLLR